VDYAGVAAIKQEILEIVFERQKSSINLPTRGLRDYAVFEALREKFGGGWQNWPEQYRDPKSQAVRKFSRTNAKRVRFHAFVQARAREQLDAVQRRAHELGMPIGLYFDLALGADRGGAEVWSDQAAYAALASCGAPPDEFNPRGQDWGLPPYSPRALRASAYEPFAELLRANMPREGALRMDHVMALMRLYWIPLGNKPDRGGYVNYPLRELLGILCRESQARKCLVIGEDLGTVPEALREALVAHGVLSYRPLLFERTSSDRYPRETMVCVSTHDLPTWRGYWSARDLELREQLGLTVDLAAEKARRKADQEALKSVLEKEGLDTSVASAHALIARTPCKIAVVQPEDVFELAEQANLPGTVDQHPNWRRKLPVPLEQWAADPRVAALAHVFAGRRPQLLPRATYRMQFHKGFRFTDARKLVPYLARLGISHLYASPFLKARPGSMHGYDIVAHDTLNPELGSAAQFDAMVADLRNNWIPARIASLNSQRATDKVDLFGQLFGRSGCGAFIEEAGEEIATIGRLYPLWAENPADRESLTRVRRAFHTLKGSGRVVGARRIGDFAWSVENLLNRVIDGTLERSGGNISKTARVLGLTRRGLYLKMRRLGIEGAIADI